MMAMDAPEATKSVNLISTVGLRSRDVGAVVDVAIARNLREVRSSALTTTGRTSQRSTKDENREVLGFWHGY